MRFVVTVRRAAVTAVLVAVALTVPAVPAAAAPGTPVFGAAIDDYPGYDPQDTCDPVAKPGVLGFRELVLRTYPSTGDSGIVRSCAGDSEVTEHKEGRAWDWTIDAADGADRARADELLAWLLATDGHGNRHANARRLGVMYIIFDHRIWGAYQAGDGWRAYAGANPHTDHVHISFSRDGAQRRTTWWTGADQPAS